MDLQIKLQMEFKDYKSDATINSKEFMLDLHQKYLFGFAESDNVAITLFFPQSDYRIFLESFDSEMNIEIFSGVKTNISSGKEETGCYFPGYFNLQIISSNGEKENYLFFVKPKNLDYSDVLEIRHYVNNFYDGLSKEIQHKSKIKQGELIGGQNPNVAQKSLYLIKKFDKIISLIEQYVQSNKEEIIKEKRVSQIITNISNSSIKWLTTKGMAKNPNVYNPEKILTKKSIVSKNTTENRVMKEEILFWKLELCEVADSVDSYLAELKEKFYIKNNDINNLESRIESQKDSWAINAYERKSNPKRLEQYKKEKEILKERIDYYLKISQLFRRYKLRLDHLLCNTWVANMDPEIKTSSSVADPRLRQLLILKNEYFGVRRSIKGSDIVGFGEKCSPKLFETYVYVLLIKMMIANGYELVSHDITKDNLMLILSDQGKITLFNGDQYCDIIYDTELKKSNDRLSSNEFVSINSSSNKPDFIVSFYEEPSKIEYAVVVEVKWRPYRVIYNENGDTDVVIKLKDYYSLGYHTTVGTKTKTVRGVISRAIVVYPDIEEKVTYIQQDELMAIGLKPCDDAENTRGYHTLSKYVFGNETDEIMEEIK